MKGYGYITIQRNIEKELKKALRTPLISINDNKVYISSNGCSIYVIPLDKYILNYESNIGFDDFFKRIFNSKKDFKLYYEDDYIKKNGLRLSRYCAYHLEEGKIESVTKVFFLKDKLMGFNKDINKLCLYSDGNYFGVAHVYRGDKLIGAIAPCSKD